MADPLLHRSSHGAKGLEEPRPTTSSKSQMAHLNQLQTYRQDSDTDTTDSDDDDDDDDEEEEEEEEEKKRVVPVPSSVSIQEHVPVRLDTGLEEVDEDEEKALKRKQMTREEILKLERQEAEQAMPKRKKRGSGGNGHKCVVEWKEDWCTWRANGGYALCWYCLKHIYLRTVKVKRGRMSAVHPPIEKEELNTFYGQLTSPPYVLKGSMQEVKDLFREWLGMSPPPLSYQPHKVKLTTGRDRPKEKVVPEAQYPDPLKALSRYVRNNLVLSYPKEEERKDKVMVPCVYTVVNMCESCRTSHSLAYRAYLIELDELDNSGKSARKPPPLTKEQKQFKTASIRVKNNVGNKKSHNHRKQQQKQQDKSEEGSSSSSESDSGESDSGSDSDSDSGSSVESASDESSEDESSDGEEEDEEPPIKKRKRVPTQAPSPKKKRKTSSPPPLPPRVSVTIEDGSLVIRVVSEPLVIRSDLVQQIKQLFLSR